MTRRTKADWLKLIDEHKDSGLSAAEFCRRNELNAKYFSLRRRELAKSKPAFVEVSTAQSNSTSVMLRVIEFTVPLDDLPSTLAALTS